MRAKRRDLLVGAAAHDRTHGEWHRSGVERRLVARHHEVVVNREIEAVVARPADVERLALDGARGHLHELLEHPQAALGGERVVVHHRAGDE
jgi:hypothetical protein